MCFPRDQFVPGADTVKTVVALKDLLKKKQKTNKSPYILCES